MFKTAYEDKPRVQTHPVGPTMTKQSHREECDINHILERFVRTGTLEFSQQNEPHYGDVTGIDFQRSMETVAKAQEMFDQLPAKVRRRFNHDPAEFLDFVQDEENRAEAEVLGLVKPQAKAGGSSGEPPKPTSETPPAAGAAAASDAPPA